MSEDTIRFVRAEQHPKYEDLKVFVESPYEAREDINGDNGLKWEEFHQTWSDGVQWAEDGYWLIDAEMIHEAAEHLSNAGWEIESDLPIEIYVPENYDGI